MNCQQRFFDPDGSVSRRWFLRECGLGLGKIGLASLMANPLARAAALGATPSPVGPASPLGSNFPGTAKSVIHLFMAGAPSQLDLFDPKPALEKLAGKPLPPSVIGNQRLAFIRPDAGVMPSVFKFAQHGQSGAWVSDLLPYTSKIADDLCFVKSVKTDQFNHAPAQIFFNTGFLQPGRPSIGSWVNYGLGSMNKDLPSFVVLSTGAGISGGAANWSSGFLPTVHSGVRFRNSGEPILNTSSPNGVDEKLQRDTIDLVNNLNHMQLDSVGDPEIETRIASHEMAFRLQHSAPELTDLSGEPESVLKLYGIDDIKKPTYARACLLARRMIERGVRFINIYHEGWDAHSDLVGNHKDMCRATDQASAALVIDLKQRGLLDETLVVWGGEFGRTPMVETNPALGRAMGRDHHPGAFTIWMAGGGIKGGQSYGETDELGYHIVDKPVHVHDVQATILHCLGLDHERLTYLHAGRHFRLTDVHGIVVKDLLQGALT
ncbi:MAG: DUF1501 domain-containing protein [Verrucomicrobiota bacterium]